MEGKLRRNGPQVSPERCMVWAEPSGKHTIQCKQGMNFPVVYYLCKDNCLEHPHFIEVPFSSTEGLYLRDVINRLAVLRGVQMPAMYSWSCKRSYRNGFVWQDLAEDDLILPAQGKDYILKGSLLQQTPTVCLQESNNNQVLPKNLGLRHKEVLRHKEHSYSRQVGTSSCLSPVTTLREMRPLLHQASLMSLPSHHSSIAAISSSSSGECRDFMATGALVSSAHTEDAGGRKSPETCTQASIHPSNELSQSNFSESPQKGAPSIDGMEENSRTPIPWNAGMGTLMSLIQAEVNQLDSFIGTEEKGHRSKEKMKRTNALLKLITCTLFLDKINVQ